MVSLEKQLCFGRMVCVRLGVDLGGSDVKLGATDLSGQQILLGEPVKVPSLTQEGPQKTIQQILTGMELVLEQLQLAWGDVADIAVTVPCPCSSDGLILNVPNLGTPETKHLWEVPFGDLLEAGVQQRAGCSIPVFACNDANAAGQDEDFERFGLSTSPRTTVFVTTGTGLGGCVISNGTVFFGLGQAGELGHMKVAVPQQYLARFASDPAPQCGCGAFGCVESRASLSGLIRRITWALGSEGRQFIERDLESRGEKVDPAVVAKLEVLFAEAPKRAAYEVRTFADRQQDAFCRWLLEDWAIMLGALFASVAAVLHPNLFIVGGGLTEMGPEAKAWFLGVIKATYTQVNQQGCFASTPENCDIQWSVSRDQGWRGAILMSLRSKAASCSQASRVESQEPE